MFVRLVLLATAVLALTDSGRAHAQDMSFGIDVASARMAAAKQMPITYGSLWAGAWNQRWGWGGIETQLQTAKAHRLVPVVQWWYWGDDISPACVENGCRDRYHGVRKDKATWRRLSSELAALIDRVMGPGAPAIVVLENEFNKGGIESYEPFDGYLAEQAQIFRAKKQRVIVSFGNWGESHWPTFDRAAAAADFVGTQILYSSLREPHTYLRGVDVLINGITRLRTLFAKPTFVTDVGFSSYPEPSYITYQDVIVHEMFSRLGELKAADVRGVVWRMLSDDPAFDVTNYHGLAERHWGLLRSDGSEKPAFSTFLAGMRSEPALPPPPVDPAPLPASSIEIWWPSSSIVLSGTQPFKAVLQGHSLATYRMYWQVDNGQLNPMTNAQTGGPHKEATVSVATWNWRGRGPYVVNFVAKDLQGRTITERSVTIAVQ